MRAGEARGRDDQIGERAGQSAGPASATLGLHGRHPRQARSRRRPESPDGAWSAWRMTGFSSTSGDGYGLRTSPSGKPGARGIWRRRIRSTTSLFHCRDFLGHPALLQGVPRRCWASSLSRSSRSGRRRSSAAGARPSSGGWARLRPTSGRVAASSTMISAFPPPARRRSTPSTPRPLPAAARTTARRAIGRPTCYSAFVFDPDGQQRRATWQTERVAAGRLTAGILAMADAGV